ncbi:hypothetical protein JFU18_26375 [Bacillus sp. TH22]|nr:MULTISPECIES: hypothetical protein [Bacillus]MBK5452019.1 hypothetical protein [Bacillus sp. TH22]MBK5454243.1 hypothetical protein [Bacillus sp. TH23]
MVKSKEFLIRDFSDNGKEVISAENVFAKQGMNLIDPATNFILDQK